VLLLLVRRNRILNIFKDIFPFWIYWINIAVLVLKMSLL